MNRFMSDQPFHCGDQVWWDDPDDGKCSRILTIQGIVYLADGIVKITEPDGSCLECYIEELS